MSGITDGLWIAACASAVAALALTLTVHQQAPQRGWRLWQAALWLNTAGITLAAASGAASAVLPLAQVLLLQWPALALVGMRRFHARLDWPGDEWQDWTVFGLAALLSSSAGVWPADSSIGALCAPVASLLMHVYACSLLVHAGTGPDARPMQLLGAVMALAAFAPAVAALPGAEGHTVFMASAVAASMASLAMAFIVTSLRFDRHERRLRASRRRLRALASIDPLTQVPNRRHFEELATKAIEHDPPASTMLVLFDLDHFKRINDQLGHSGGDRALRLVARCVRDVLRVQDVPCRYGGDEFALLLRHASVHDAMRVAGRLVTSVQAMAAEAMLPSLSLSFGMVQVRPAELLIQALQRADQALYEAKRQGRSRAVAAGGNANVPKFIESRPLGLTSA